MVVPNHLSSQNRISAPFLMEKELNGKKYFFSCHGCLISASKHSFFFPLSRHGCVISASNKQARKGKA
jgi:hypothetical protein